MSWPCFVFRALRRKEIIMKSKGIIIKLDFSSEQTVGEITKFVGLMQARYMVYIIDSLNLDANPRSSKTGAVTRDIQESIVKYPEIFPFMTKGILLAASDYEKLDRGRIHILPDDNRIEGILDGGHNTLAIGLHIMNSALEYAGAGTVRGQKTWDEFKTLWAANRDVVDEYIAKMDDDDRSLSFYVPIELLVPRDPENTACVEQFKGQLMDICEARNNNVQLKGSDKSNQLGYFEYLKSCIEEVNHQLAGRIEWKSNEGGDKKAQDIVALAWIPLNLTTPVKDEYGREIEHIAPSKIYAGKGRCQKQFEKLMESPEVTRTGGDGYKRTEIINSEVASALKIAADLPALYDYIYEQFPYCYNAGGFGKYGNITTVSKLNKGKDGRERRNKTAPFSGEPVGTASPEGFIVPVVYGLQAIMERVIVDGKPEIRWKRDPMEFLKENLKGIVRNYRSIIPFSDYDPQKVGKASKSYTDAFSYFRMADAGILDVGV